MVRDPELYAVTSSLWEPGTPAYRHTHDAMAGQVRITILNRDAATAHDAADEAFEEVDRIEQDLSRFVPGSDVWLIGRLTPGVPLTVGVDTLECLKLAARLHAETLGAFDVTVGALRECWRDAEGAVLSPSDDDVRQALGRTGMGLLAIHEDDMAVSVKAQGVGLDLGGIGKGYAVDAMVQVLREWEIDAALISTAGSTYCAIGHPPGREGWRVGLDVADLAAGTPTFYLCDRALSGSGVLDDHLHIIDPRTGQLVRGRHATWSSAPSAAVADALSTAFLLMDADQVEAYCREHPEVGGMLAVLQPQASQPALLRFGRWD